MSGSGAREVDHCWRADELPSNASVADDVVITGVKAFARYFAEGDGALTIGGGSMLDGVRFCIGPGGRISIGRGCRANDAVLLAERSVVIGDRVVLGWNVTIADADFHPVDPEARRIDAEACAPGGDPGARPPMPAAPVTVGDDCYVGPNAAILKGVVVGEGAFVEAGSVVVDDVPPRTRVAGNPARVVETW